MILFFQSDKYKEKMKKSDTYSAVFGSILKVIEIVELFDDSENDVKLVFVAPSKPLAIA